MKRNDDGFTLIEVIIVIGIIGILAAISAPNIRGWMQSAQYRGVAQELNSALRDARSRAITTNRPHRIVLTVSNFHMEEWDLATLAFVDVVPPREVELPASVKLVTAATSLVFNPNGSAGGGTVNISDLSDTVKFRVIVASSGRVRIN